MKSRYGTLKVYKSQRRESKNNGYCLKIMEVKNDKTEEMTCSVKCLAPWVQIPSAQYKLGTVVPAETVVLVAWRQAEPYRSLVGKCSHTEELQVQ